VFRLFADNEKHVSNVDRVARSAAKCENRPCMGGRDFNRGLGRLDFDDQLVDGDVVSNGNVPKDNLSVCEAFPDIWQTELIRH
jgi:hypothetical protein